MCVINQGRKVWESWSGSVRSVWSVDLVGEESCEGEEREGRKGSLWRARRGKGHKWRRRKETMKMCPRIGKEGQGVRDRRRRGMR